MDDVSTDNADSSLRSRWLLLGKACGDAELSHADTAVLWQLAERAGTKGTCWPSLSTIASDAGCDRRTAVRSITRLESRGYITRLPGSRTESNRYRIGGGESAPTGRGEAATSGESAPRGELVPLGRGEAVQKVGARLPLKSRKRIQKENPERTRATARYLEAPDWLPAESWLTWCKHKGSKFSRQAQQGALNRLAKLRDEGHCPAKVIAHSLEHGWQGVFADNRNGTTRVNGSRPGAIPIDNRTHDELAAANAAEGRRMGLG